MRAVLLGICSALFFAFTFVLNRSMELGGGSWLWSASLRFFFMLPFLFIIVGYKKELKNLFCMMKENPREWLIWSFVGFGLFYAPLCFASAYSPGWLIAGSWQMTIIAGTLLAPLFILNQNGPIQKRAGIPLRELGFSLIILVGVIIMQADVMSGLPMKDFLLGFLPILIAAFAYPLGNRKMMELTNGRLTAFQRVLGMTIASLPLWIILAGAALVTDGMPSGMQTLQSLVVALASGIIATVLFFKATDLVRHDMKKLAAVEATQSMELIFALAGEILFLSAAFPSAISLAGIVIVMAGMALHSYGTALAVKKDSKKMAETDC
ncbi:membrane protein [Bacillus sp. FJAT-27916]|uniref:DMT family transporter n=1 Tax=Bacillus sp. FJAT-27916 TaxID=1679169 RepID=UPI000670E177|nr:multidrug resistance efflux transporter family protein [Bacillus sp. FJAT-27916]KMY44839.1 membrane protein [Bacillus sp. FJAT-27916]